MDTGSIALTAFAWRRPTSLCSLASGLPSPALRAASLASALLLFSPGVGALERGRSRSSLLVQPRQWATGKAVGEILAAAAEGPAPVPLARS